MKAFGLFTLVLVFLVSFIRPISAICANSSWVACADAALATFATAQAAYDSSSKNATDKQQFYCNKTVTYYTSFAECTTLYDCWNFPYAVSLRASRYNVSQCSNDTVSGILGGSDAGCGTYSCSELLPGSVFATFSPRSSDSSLAETGTLAALSILAASLIF